MSTPKITFHKSEFCTPDFRRYEVLADGKSIGWTCRDVDMKWSVHFRRYDDTIGVGFDQDTRSDAASSICINAIHFYDYGLEVV